DVSRKLPLLGRDPCVSQRAGGRREQRNLAAGGIEGVVAWALCELHRRCLVNAEAYETPQEHTQPWDVVPPGLALALPKVRRVEEFVEGGIHLRGAVHVAQIGPAADPGVGPRSDQALGKPQRTIPDRVGGI